MCYPCKDRRRAIVAETPGTPISAVVGKQTVGEPAEPFLNGDDTKTHRWGRRACVLIWMTSAKDAHGTRAPPAADAPNPTARLA